MPKQNLAPKDIDEQDGTWEAFMEIFTAAVKIGIVVVCIYMFKAIFEIIRDMYYLVEGQPIELAEYVIGPVVVLIIIGCVAISYLKKF